MKPVNLRLADLERSTIPIGFQDENLHTQVRIDCKIIFKDYPAAVVSLTVTPPKGDPYPAMVIRDGDIVVWNVTASDTAYHGDGRVQFTFVDGEEVIKTVRGKTSIAESDVPSGTAPTPIQNWITNANVVLDEAASVIEAASHAPIIDDNGYWAVWDADAEEYVATEYKAQGTDGHDGVGIVSIEKTGTSGLVDTYTITFTSGSPVTYTVTNGRDADPTALIDDTSTGTGRTWSAKKISDEQSSLMTQINSAEEDVDAVYSFLKTNDFDSSTEGKSNILNPPYTSNDVMDGKQIKSSGEIDDKSSMTVSPLIPVDVGETYGLKVHYGAQLIGSIASGNNYKNGYGFFASDGVTVVSRGETLLHSVGNDIYVFPVPQGAKYVRFAYVSQTSSYYSQALGYFNQWILLPGADDNIDDSFFVLKQKKADGIIDKIKRDDGSHLLLRDNRFGIRTRMLFGAHNGAEYYAPECSVPAYRIAGQQGWEWAWISGIKFSSEGSMYVIHDETVDRTTDGTGNINQKTDAQIDALNIDQTGEGYKLSDFTQAELKIPTFEQVLQQCVRYGMKMLISLHKFPLSYSSASDMETWDNFLNLLKEYNVPAEDISCYLENAATAQICREHIGNDVEISVFLGQNATAQDLIDWFTTNSITGRRAGIININNVSSSAVKLMHENGIRVYVYGSRQETDASNCATWGVDIFQNSKLFMLTN